MRIRDIFVPIHGSDRHIISRELARRSKVIRLRVKHDDVAMRPRASSGPRTPVTCGHRTGCIADCGALVDGYPAD